MFSYLFILSFLCFVYVALAAAVGNLRHERMLSQVVTTDIRTYKVVDFAGNGTRGDNMCYFNTSIPIERSVLDVIFDRPAYVYVYNDPTQGQVVYVVDTLNSHIKIIRNGVVNDFVGRRNDRGEPLSGYQGEGLAIGSRIYSPSSIDVDINGDLYIADTQNDRIHKVTLSDGYMTKIVGSGSQGVGTDNVDALSTALNSPGCVLVDKQFNLYIADSANNKVRFVNASSNNISTIIGTGVGGSSDGNALVAMLNDPQGMALDLNGNLYIADAGNNKIRFYNATLKTIKTLSTFTELISPMSVSLNPYNGDLFIANTGRHRIDMIPNFGKGTLVTIAGNSSKAGYTPPNGLEAREVKFYSPSGVFFDSKSGTIFVADTNNNRIRVVAINPSDISVDDDFSSDKTKETHWGVYLALSVGAILLALLVWKGWNEWEKCKGAVDNVDMELNQLIKESVGWDTGKLTIFDDLDKGGSSEVFRVGFTYEQFGRSNEKFYALKLFKSENPSRVEDSAIKKVPQDRIRPSAGSSNASTVISEGDEVLVKYQDEWLPGTISTRHDDGTYDIKNDKKKWKGIRDYNWNCKLALEEQRTLDEVRNRLSKINAQEKVIQCHGLFRGEVKNEKMREKLNILRTERWKVGLLLTLGEGGSLKQLITDDMVSQWDTLFKLEVYLNICSCLSDLHLSGITHKDFTSANILLRHPLGKNKKADILICDLGLAKINKIISSKTYVVGSTISLPSGKSSSKIEGTYPYMAPEILKNLPTCNSRFVDIYANAIIGWELFEGKMYFDIFNKYASQLNELEPNIPNRKTMHDSVVDLVCETKTNGALGNNSRPPLNIQTAVEGASPGAVAFPPRIADMLRLCWNSDRSKRLTSQECVERVKYVLEIERKNKFDVFLSHLWGSKRFVYFIYEYLNANMLNTWYDVKNMDHDMKLSMEKGVKNSEVFLCCLNEVYQTKPNCMREFDDAVRLNKKIVVILLQTIDFGLEKPLWKTFNAKHSCSSGCKWPCDKKWKTSWEVDASILNAMKHKKQANGLYTVDMMYVDVSQIYENVEWVNSEQKLISLEKSLDEIDPGNVEEKKKLLEDKDEIHEKRREMVKDLHAFLDKCKLNVLVRQSEQGEHELIPSAPTLPAGLHTKSGGAGGGRGGIKANYTSVPQDATLIDKVNEEFLCPITMEVMKDPVMCEDGHSYERDAIEEWLSKNKTSPKTNLPMSDKLIPNHALRNAIESEIGKINSRGGGNMGIFVGSDSQFLEDEIKRKTTGGKK